MSITHCPHCGAKNMGAFPPGVNAPTQYGTRTKAFVALCRNECFVPYKKTCDLYKELTGHPLNASTVYNNDKELFE